MKRLSGSLLMAFSLWISSAQAQTPPPADAVLQEATQQASKEHKKVFVIFHASWCTWCHRMDSLMNDPACKKYFDDNYVVRHLTVLESKDKKNLENPGAMELLAKYHGEKQGIPFWLIFDTDGRLLADSDMRPDGAGLDTPGSNVGCPATKEEVAFFMKVLGQTSSLKQGQLALIGKKFEKDH